MKPSFQNFPGLKLFFAVYDSKSEISQKRQKFRFKSGLIANRKRSGRLLQYEYGSEAAIPYPGTSTEQNPRGKKNHNVQKLERMNETMRLKKMLALILAACMLVGLLAGCANSGDNNSPSGNSSGNQGGGSGESSLNGKRVRVVIGSTSTGGDSYMIADMVTRYLSAELGFNGKVDPVGNAAALDAISTAAGDGTTIMMFHDMTFTSVLFGAVGQEYALENLTVGPRIGVNPGGCFASKADAPYDSLHGAAEWLNSNPDGVVRVNIEAGSASHLCFVVWYMWVKDTYGESVASRIKAVVGGTTDEKKQRLWDGNTDIIYADYSSCVEFTKEGVDAQLAMKIFDTSGKVEGTDLVSMAEDDIIFQGENFSFNKDFFMIFPKNMDESIVQELADAMQKVCQNPDFQSEMSAMGYSALTPEETDLAASRDYIMKKSETSKVVVDVAPALDELT